MSTKVARASAVIARYIATPLEPSIVLDVNVLRDQRVIEACIARFERDGRPIAVPEMALFELTKHPDRWESTVVQSLQLLAGCPEAVVLTRSLKPLGLAEEASGTSTVSVLAPQFTEAFRALLRDIDAGGGADLQSFRQAVQSYRAQLDHGKHAEDSLRTMQALKGIARTALPHELVARIGADLAQGDRTTFRDFLRSQLLITEQRNAHVRRGVAVQAADALLCAPSVSYLFALAVGAIGLEWLFTGGIDTARPGRVANDVLDIEYLLAGLWIGRLVSTDARARSRFDDLKMIGASAWPSHADLFGRAEAIGPDDDGSWLTTA
jgi:hypothetical protein